MSTVNSEYIFSSIVSEENSNDDGSNVDEESVETFNSLMSNSESGDAVATADDSGLMLDFLVKMSAKNNQKRQEFMKEMIDK